MKNELTTFCRLISERISKFFKKSQNKKPTIVKNKIGFKLNFGVIQFERSKEWSSLSGENTIFSGDAGSSPALHSFLFVISPYWALNPPRMRHLLHQSTIFLFSFLFRFILVRFFVVLVAVGAV